MSGGRPDLLRALRVLRPPSPLAPGRRRTVEVSPSLKALPRLMSASWRCMSNSTFDLFSMYLETLGIAGLINCGAAVWCEGTEEAAAVRAGWR